MAADHSSGHCKFKRHSGRPCPNDAGDNGLCKWHDPDIVKDRPGDRAELEAYAHSGRSMEGFSLRRADLRSVNLVTFTTLGYGDLSPQGWARPVAAFEAFCGSFTLALFVVVFVKKMTR